MEDYLSKDITELAVVEPLIENNHVILNYSNPDSTTDKVATFNTRYVEFTATYTWSILDKPDGASPQISGTNSDTASVTIDTNGFYVIMLNIRDSNNNEKTEYAYISTLSTLRYVRDGATGSNDGSDWANAYNDLPATLERGCTYFVADGNYTNHTFNDTESGALPIIIKKAIPGTSIASHGNSDDWSDSYGDEQAIFTKWEIIKSFYIFDGQTGGGPGSWDSGYGIKLDYPYYGTSRYVVFLHGYPYGINSPGNLVFRHIDFEHIGIDMEYPGGRIFSFYSPDSLTDGYKNIVISNCYLHDCSSMMISSVYTTNVLVEYCYFARNNSNAEYHGEAWQDYGSANIVIRYNKFEDVTGTAFIALKKGYGHSHVNWAVHGNIFMHTSGYTKGVGMGSLGDTNPYAGAVTRNILFYNNTVYNVNGYNAAVNFDNSDGTCYAYNNIFLFNESKINYVNTKHDYSYYFGNTEYTGYPPLSEHDYVTGTDNPCIDSGNYDFHLSESAGPGLSLPWPYNYDMDGYERGADGSWDIGAYEYP
ncbi:MAG: hypothetical protein JW864_10135 [Spirochaetes bacterium]|nr:hypothetical protein [Spirochaetota bacterium]